MSILVCTLCRNEMGRYLQQVVPIWQEFADDILVVDDRSTDGSREYMIEEKCRVYDNLSEPMMGAEHDIRQYLWDIATQSKHDILLWLDADMYPACNPKDAFREDANSFAFKYYDLWGEWEYRDDVWWDAHTRPRVWAIRNPGPNSHKLPRAAWHSGHIPDSAKIQPLQVMDDRYSLLHLAYATPEGRKRQFAKYALLYQDSALSPAAWGHALTIMDKAANTAMLPFAPEYHVDPNS